MYVNIIFLVQKFESSLVLSFYDLFMVSHAFWNHGPRDSITEARGPCFSHDMGYYDQILLYHAHWLIIFHILFTDNWILMPNGQFWAHFMVAREIALLVAMGHKWIIIVKSWIPALLNLMVFSWLRYWLLGKFFEKCTVAVLGGPSSLYVTGNTSRLNQPKFYNQGIKHDCVCIVGVKLRGCCLAAPGDHSGCALGSLTPTIHTQSCLIPIITWWHHFFHSNKYYVN